MDLLQEILKQVASHPGAAEILEKANSGELSVMEAAMQIQKLIEGTETANSLVKKMDHVNDMGIDPDKMVFRHPNGEEGLNPLFEAKLAERLSQDGDIPELRVGPLPEGCRPAVPVHTFATNPVIVGMQLEKAREDVEKALEDLQAGYIKACEENTFLTPPSPPIDIPNLYERGKTPLLYDVGSIPVSSILEVPEKTQRELVYSCIGTTQGRVSLINPITALLRKALSDKGVKNKVVSSHNRLDLKWTIQAWGPEDLSEGFNPITTAANYFIGELESQLPEVKEVYFTINPINGYSDRVFGWKCTFNY